VVKAKAKTRVRKKAPPTEPTLCGAKCRSKSGTCRFPAGWGTDHVGYGYCRKHLGNAPKYRQHAARLQAEELARDIPYEELIAHTDLSDLVRELKSRSDISDISEELAMARAVTLDFINRSREMEAALLRWHASHGRPYKAAMKEYAQELEDARASESWDRYAQLVEALPDPLDYAAGKPPKVPDMAEAVGMLRNVVAIADQVLARRDAGSIPVEDVVSALVEVVGVTERATRDHIGDVTLRAALLADLEDGWSRIRIRRREPDGDGAPALHPGGLN
jgi:hypothetical protein